MREFAKISPVLWTSQKFMALGCDRAKLLYLYIHTCPHANSIGCFRLLKGYISADPGWEDSAIDRAIDRAINTGLIGWNETENIILITRFLEFSPITNRKHATGAIKLAMALPDCEEKNIVINVLWEDRYCCEMLEGEGRDKGYPFSSTTHYILCFPLPAI